MFGSQEEGVKRTVVPRIVALVVVIATMPTLACKPGEDRGVEGAGADSVSQQLPDWTFAGYSLGDSWDDVGKVLPCSATTDLADRRVTECTIGEDSTLTFGPDGILEEIVAE